MKKQIIKIILLGLIVAMLLCSCGTKNPDENSTTSSEKTLFDELNEPKADATVKRAFLCIGQSNMGGRGFIDDPVSGKTNLSGNSAYNSKTFPVQVVDVISDDRIYMMNSKGSDWVKMSEPIFIDPYKYAGASLVASFAKAYVDTFDETVGIIAVPGIGGKSLSKDWAVGGTLYNTAIEMCKKAMETTEIIGILWHQGESDTTNTNYADDFEILIDSICSELGLDHNKIAIITGELFSSNSADDTMTFTTGNSIGVVNNALHSIENDGYYKYYSVVSGKGLHCNPDHIHADSPSLRLLGYRYFSAFYKMATNKEYSFVDDYQNYVRK